MNKVLMIGMLSLTCVAAMAEEVKVESAPGRPSRVIIDGKEYITPDNATTVIRSPSGSTSVIQSRSGTNINQSLEIGGDGGRTVKPKKGAKAPKKPPVREREDDEDGEVKTPKSSEVKVEGARVQAGNVTIDRGSVILK